MSTTPEDEIRELFARWFDASASRDLDGAMAPVAADVVSYEHEAPLACCGRAAVREVCERGFDALPAGGFRWDIPDLQVIVRDDLAVAWGLNRVRVGMAGEGAARESWSRGTRVFQRIDGEWRMVHQHLSFPVDPVTGLARTDLVPAGLP